MTIFDVEEVEVIIKDSLRIQRSAKSLQTKAKPNAKSATMYAQMLGQACLDSLGISELNLYEIGLSPFNEGTLHLTME